MYEQLPAQPREHQPADASASKKENMILRV